MNMLAVVLLGGLLGPGAWAAADAVPSASLRLADHGNRGLRLPAWWPNNSLGWGEPSFRPPDRLAAKASAGASG